MFNSQNRNNDPLPYLWRSGERTAEPSRWGNRPPHIYKPRPEFDNNPNPILIELREVIEEIPTDRARTYRINSEAISRHGDAMRHTPEHIDHARRVLARLAALA